MSSKNFTSVALHKLVYLQKYIALVALAVMCAINLVEILLRFMFDNSFIWIQDITVMLMLWMTFCGFSYVSYSKQDVLVDVFINFLPEKAKKSVTVITDLAILFFVILFSFFAIKLAITQKGQGTVTTHLPLIYDTLPVIINAITLVLIYIENTIKHSIELVSGRKPTQEVQA